MKGLNKTKMFIFFSALALFGFLAFKTVKIHPLLKVASRYKSRMYCSCRMQMELDHDYCRAWTDSKQVPLWLVPVEFDDATKTAKAGVSSWSHSSSYNQALNSCVLN